MSYTVQSGDNLWNIAKTAYKLNENTAIANKVNEIAKANNIENIDLIFDGQTIELGNEYNSSDKANFSAKVEEFNNWTNTTDPNSTLQYVEKGNTDEETANNIGEFSKQYIEHFGKDGNIDLETFAQNNPELDAKSAESIYKMIDMDGQGGITPDEHASYLSLIDSSDGKFDGNMNLDKYNTIGAEVPVFADEQYANTPYNNIHEKSKEGLQYATPLMQHFHDKYFSQKQ